MIGGLSMKKNKVKDDIIKGYYDCMVNIVDVHYNRKPFKFEVKQRD